MRIEHWDVAFNHGKTAALNMLGQDVPHEVVPYFFSVLADWGELEYVGPAYDVGRGDPARLRRGGSFTNWYLEDGRSWAALTFGRSDDLEAARRLISAGGPLERSVGGSSAMLATPTSASWPELTRSADPGRSAVPAGPRGVGSAGS